MVNYILLEGIEMYVFLFLMVMLAVMGVIGFFSSVYSDEQTNKYKSQLHIVRQHNLELQRENVRLKLKCGEIKVGEKIDV